MSFADRFSGYGDLGLIGVRMPNFTIDKTEYEKLGVSPKVSNEEFVLELCKQRLKSRKIVKSRSSEYEQRLEKEFNILSELGYIDYILLIWDICNFADLNDIPRGAGRGSAAGSLILYLMGVTAVDPIKYNLFFERFVSKARSKKTIHNGVTYFDGGLLPDVDLDFCYYRRQEVLEYIEKKFPSRTCKILTCSTLQGKIALKESAKIAADYSESEVKVLADYIGKVFGKVSDLESAFSDSKDLKNWICEDKKKYKYCDNRTIADIAVKIEGLPNNYGVHPAAMAISYGDIGDIFPLQKSKDGHLTTAFDMYTVQNYAVKVDVLGLKTVSVLREIEKLTKVRVEDIDVDDESIYLPFENITAPHGIFQIEAPTQFSAAQKVKPKNLMEVSDLMALARPGALSYIGEYADVKFGRREMAKNHPIIDDILKNSKGVCLFQEQLMAIGHKAFGLTLEEAETLRKVIGKKQVDKMPEWKSRVYEAAKTNNLPESLADFYWKILDDSKNYSFNKCLSPETIVETPDGLLPIGEIKIGDKVLSYDVDEDKNVFSTVLDVIPSSAEVYEVEMEDGSKIACSLDHKFLTQDLRMKPLKDILRDGDRIMCKEQYEKNKTN